MCTHGCTTWHKRTHTFMSGVKWQSLAECSPLTPTLLQSGPYSSDSPTLLPTNEATIEIFFSFFLLQRHGSDVLYILASLPSLAHRSATLFIKVRVCVGGQVSRRRCAGVLIHACVQRRHSLWPRRFLLRLGAHRHVRYTHCISLCCG
jgi:hypothetical protein